MVSIRKADTDWLVDEEQVCISVPGIRMELGTVFIEGTTRT
jgi:hypothetical protein